MNLLKFSSLSPFLLLALPFASFGDFDFLIDMYYDPSKTYSPPESVVLETDPSEIYTAKTSVPVNTPPPNSQYWSSSEDHTNELTSENSDELGTIPSDNFDQTTPGTPPTDEVPSFSLSTLELDYSENGTEAIATISANNAVSYALSEELDYELFDLDDTTFELSFKSSPNYESPQDSNGDNVYKVVVVATNSNGTASQTVEISVQNVIEQPVITSSSTAVFNSGASGVVYTATATDNATYSVSGTDYQLFTINSATGDLTFNSSPDYNNPADYDLDNVYELVIQAENSAGSEFLSLSVNVLESEIPISRFLGISTRGIVSSTKAMYGSIAVTGTENKLVAFMGKGKTMEAQGITDYVTDPALIIYKLTNGVWGVYRTIDNWEDATGSESILSVSGKEGITLPVDALEAAIVLNLEPGNYSAILTSTESSEKEALVEAYEIPSDNEVSRFLGISTRGIVSSTKAMYGSIAITGTENKKVAFMGKGKTMEAQGITDYVSDPALIIYKLTNGIWGLYRTIDNWTEATGTENISAYTGKEGITLPVSDTEAAIVLDLEPGNYSAILTSTESDSKEALVEAYEIVE